MSASGGSLATLLRITVDKKRGCSQEQPLFCFVAFLSGRRQAEILLAIQTRKELHQYRIRLPGRLLDHSLYKSGDQHRGRALQLFETS